MSHSQDNKKQKGFTIVELLISISIFSVIILAVSFTVIQVSRLYYKGVILSRTQDASRNLTEEISRQLQFEGSSIHIAGPFASKPDQRSVCLGTTRFTYVLGKKKVNGASSNPDDIRHVVWRDEVPNSAHCLTEGNMPDLTANIPTAGGRDVLTENMRIAKFNVSESAPGSGLWNIEVKVLYGARDLMTPDAGIPDNCKAGVVGSQWCAVAEYDTSVLRRLRG